MKKLLNRFNNDKKTIIITGGSGYIGIHLVHYLFRLKKYNIIVVDKVKHQYIKKKKIEFVKVDLSKFDEINYVIKKFSPKLIIHLAGLSHITDSFEQKNKYKINNELASGNLFKAMKLNYCKNIIFSSSCLVYRNKTNQPESKKKLIGLSPYAKNKIIIEKKILEYSKKFKFNYCILRFFNVAGALGGSEKIGFGRKAGNRIIPIILDSILNNKKLFINGTDHKTNDGTCVRDFVHPIDLVIFIEKLIKYFDNGDFKEVINLGSGYGFSIKQLINLCIKKTNIKKLIVKINDKRKGDAPILIANVTKAKKFGWSIANSNINNIINSTYDWIKKN